MIILLDGNPAGRLSHRVSVVCTPVQSGRDSMRPLVAPYQLQRRPRQPFEWNFLEFARAMAQNVAEIRALIGWLLDEGCPSVGLLGISFGGWLAGLTACSDARIACSVLTVPGGAHEVFW